MVGSLNNEKTRLIGMKPVDAIKQTLVEQGFSQPVKEYEEKLLDVGMVHSLSSGKGKMFLCAACHAFTPHVNAWKNLIGIVVQIQARG